jgi:dephospho-CoA kinase
MDATKECGGVIVPSFAVIGLLSSGKSTYAGEIRDALKKEFRISVCLLPSFSVPISAVAREIFNSEDGPDGKPDRTLLQAIGNKMREIRPTVWADCLIRMVSEDKVPFVVEGFRHPSELNAFRKSFTGIVVVRVDADESQRMEAYRNKYGKYPTKEQLEDPSEKAVEEMTADLTLHNTFDREALARQMAGLVRDIRNGTLLRS